MEYNFKLPTLVSPNREAYKTEPVKIDFIIPYFTLSGLNVRFMKIMNDNEYEGTPWVRYVTESKEYQIRK
jgi:AP-1 complex subunit mu